MVYIDYQTYSSGDHIEAAIKKEYIIRTKIYMWISQSPNIYNKLVLYSLYLLVRARSLVWTPLFPLFLRFNRNLSRMLVNF